MLCGVKLLLLLSLNVYLNGKCEKKTRVAGIEQEEKQIFVLSKFDLQFGLSKFNQIAS